MKARRSVHIIDDEAEVRDALTLLLSTAQIESRSYGSAEEYLTLNRLNEPACILLDNQLPGMSGIELLRQIVAATKDSTRKRRWDRLILADAPCTSPRPPCYGRRRSLLV